MSKAQPIDGVSAIRQGRCCFQGPVRPVARSYAPCYQQLAIARYFSQKARRVLSYVATDVCKKRFGVEANVERQ